MLILRFHSYSQIPNANRFPIGFWFSGDMEQNFYLTTFEIESNDQQPSVGLLLSENSFKIGIFHISLLHFPVESFRRSPIIVNPL